MALRRESMAVEMAVADSPFQRAERVSESRSPAINQRFTEATGGASESAKCECESGSQRELGQIYYLQPTIIK